MLKKYDFLRRLSHVVMDVKTANPTNDNSYRTTTFDKCKEWGIFSGQVELTTDNIVVDSIVMICKITVKDPAVVAVNVNYYSEQAWECYED